MVEVEPEDDDGGFSPSNGDSSGLSLRKPPDDYDSDVELEDIEDVVAEYSEDE